MWELSWNFNENSPVAYFTQQDYTRPSHGSLQLMSTSPPSTPHKHKSQQRSWDNQNAKDITECLQQMIRRNYGILSSLDAVHLRAPLPVPILIRDLLQTLENFAHLHGFQIPSMWIYLQ